MSTQQPDINARGSQGFINQPSGPVTQYFAHQINHIVQGLGDLPTHYDGPVRNFLEYYLGAADSPAPFGGRRDDLAALNDWLDDQSAPLYALLAAPAGRGKSALLAHWVARLQDRADLSVVFFPISVRYSTNRENVVFAALYARLAHLHGETATRAADAGEYRSVFIDYLRRPPPSGRRIVIVLDALDESAGWEMGADVFPSGPPAHLRVLLSARHRAGDADGRGWLTQLGWEAPGRAKVFSLARLDRAGVADVLIQMGNPLDALAAKFDVIERLHILSEGDPLLVRLYVEALLPQGEQAALITPDDLLTLKPGLESYLDRWWDEQRRLWGEANPLRERATKALLNLCALAFGPLTRDDVLRLAHDECEDSETLLEAARALRRLLIGDGKTVGYVFSHPRLRDYFAGRLSSAERTAWHARFLDDGCATLEGLERKTLKPEHAPEYVVKYYSAHLAATGASPNDFYALMCEGWLRAWEWIEGAPDGFLADARRAWERALAEDPPALGLVARAALCVASVASVSANVPSELLAACVQHGLINRRLALVMAQTKPVLEERSACLADVAGLLPPADQVGVLKEALSVAQAIGDEYDRARALKAIAERLPSEARDLLAEALRAAQAIRDERWRASALSAVAARLPLETSDLLTEALRAARAIWDGRWRASALSAVAARLLPEAHDLLAEALTVARAIEYEPWRASALSAVAERLPLEAHDLLAEVLSAARAIEDERWRVSVLSAVAERLPPEARAAVLVEALSAARAIGADDDRARALSAVAAQLPSEARAAVLAEALSAVRAIRNEEWCASTLSVVVEWLPSEASDLLAEALSAARAFGDEGLRARMLSAVAARLPPEARGAVLAEALTAARALGDERLRARTLSAVAARLPLEATDLLAKALAAARVIGDEGWRASSLSAVAARLPPEARGLVLVEALSAARAIGYEGWRMSALSVVTTWLPPAEQVGVLKEALSTAQTIGDEGWRAAALSVVAARLPPEARDLLAEALRAARAIKDERWRASALSAVAERLPSEAHDLLAEALRAAQAVKDERWRAPTLSAIAARLPPEASELLAEVLAAARAIKYEEWRASALNAVAARLPPEARAEALAEARAIGAEYDHVHTLSAVAEQLPPEARAEVLAEALSAARAIGNEYYRASALRVVAECLPPEAHDLLAEVLRATQAIGNGNYCASVLSAVAARLSPKARGSVLAESPSAARARAIGDEESRASARSAVIARWASGLQLELLQKACVLANQNAVAPAILKSLAPHWSEMCRAHGRSEISELSETLRIFSSAGRPRLLEALEALLPVIARLGGEAALQETARAIIDTAQWWP